jgi:hypothetical protein
MHGSCHTHARGSKITRTNWRITVLPVKKIKQRHLCCSLPPGAASWLWEADRDLRFCSGISGPACFCLGGGGSASYQCSNGGGAPPPFEHVGVVGAVQVEEIPLGSSGHGGDPSPLYGSLGRGGLVEVLRPMVAIHHSKPLVQCYLSRGVVPDSLFVFDSTSKQFNQHAFIDARNRIDIFSGGCAQFNKGDVAARKLVDLNVSISSVLVRQLNEPPTHDHAFGHHPCSGRGAPVAVTT